jgi:hypothetical protein
VICPSIRFQLGLSRVCPLLNFFSRVCVWGGGRLSIDLSVLPLFLPGWAIFSLVVRSFGRSVSSASQSVSQQHQEAIYESLRQHFHSFIVVGGFSCPYFSRTCFLKLFAPISF